MSTVVIKAENLLAAVKADPAKVITLEQKRDNKPVKGTWFYDMYVNVGQHVHKKPWFSFENVPLVADIADPNNKEDKRNDYEGARLAFCTSVSKAGAFGEALKLLSPVWIDYVKQLGAAGKVMLGDKREVKPLLRDKYSESHKTKPGQAMEDPLITLKISFDLYSDKYPEKHLQGKPKTVILDWDKPYDEIVKRKNDKGEEVEHTVRNWKPATVVNDAGVEELVNEANIHKFVVKNSIIRRGRICMLSASAYKDGFSWPMQASWVVIEKGTESGFVDDDDVSFSTTSLVAALPAPGGKDAADELPTTPAPSATPATTQVATSAPGDVLEDILSDLN